MGTTLLLAAALGFVILGPERMHTMIGHLFRAKAELDKASRSMKSRLTAELHAPSPEPPPAASGQAACGEN
jgi:Sec-independent protein translocase protein TatA